MATYIGGVFGKTGANSVTNYPVDTADGDLLIVFATEDGTVTSPGWTQFGGGAPGTWWRLKPAGSTDTSVEVAGTNTVHDLVVYRGAKAPVLTAQFAKDTGSSSSTTMTAPAVTNNAAGGTVVRHYSWVSASSTATATTPTGHTLRHVSSPATNNSTSYFPRLIADAPTTGTAVPSITSTRSPSETANVATRSFVMEDANKAPNAPTLTAPIGLATVDRSVAQRFTWTFSDANVGDTQSKYDLRYKLTSATTWTQVSGTTPNTFHDFAGGTFAAGDYEWQVRTYDAQGLVGPYSASAFFVAASTPAAPTITSPLNNGTLTVSAFLVQWSTPNQDAYQVRTVRDNAGTADVATVYYDSGIVVSATARSQSVSFPVNNRFEHVQVRIRSSNLWSTWASARVSVSYSSPQAPTVAPTPQAASAAIQVGLIRPAENMLTANQASLETDATGWDNAQNVTVARSTAAALFGTASLSMTATAAGDMAAATSQPFNAVVPGAQYSIGAHFRAATTARQVYVRFIWVRSDGALASPASTDGTRVTNTTSGWTQATVTATAPANAATCRVDAFVVAPAAGEVHYLDGITLKQGTSTTFSEGGVVVVSLDVWRRETAKGGDGIRIATNLPAASNSFADQTPASGVDYQYRAVAVAANGTTTGGSWQG